jgi:hypothetical protein
VFWLYIPSCYLHLIKPCPLLRLIPLSLFRGQQFSFSNSQLFFTVTSCRPVAHPRPTGLVYRIYNPPEQDGPAIRPGTGYPFWSLFTKCMAALGLFFSPVTTRGFQHRYEHLNFCV